MQKHILFLFSAAILLVAQSTYAISDYAEWEFETPGGNFISHTEPYIGVYGTVLKAPAGSGGTLGRVSDRIYVKNLKRWRFYPQAIVGRTSTGYFAFNEGTREVATFRNESELNEFIDGNSLGEPVSGWHNEVHGWNLGWFSSDRKKLSFKEAEEIAGLSEYEKYDFACKNNIFDSGRCQQIKTSLCGEDSLHVVKEYFGCP